MHEPVGLVTLVASVVARYRDRLPFGAMPAGGAEIPTYLSYVAERRLAKHPEEFGHGAIEGVPGPEATNNASAAGVLAPLLTLGLPTSATAAVLLAGFQQYGIQPGPLLFQNEPQLVWGLIASLFIGNTLLLVLNLPLAPVWARLLRIARPYLYAGILVFASVGAYTTDGSPMGLYLLFVMGLLGVFMRRFGLPIVPIIIGVNLGPLGEQQLRRALQLSDGHPSALVSTPLSIALYVALGLAVIVPLVWRIIAARRGRGDQTAAGTEPITPISDGSVEVQPDSPPRQSLVPATAGTHADGEPRADTQSEVKVPAVTTQHGR